MEISTHLIILLGTLFLVYSTILFYVISSRGITIRKLEHWGNYKDDLIYDIHETTIQLDNRVASYHLSAFYDKENNTIVTFDNLENIGEL